LKHNTKFVSKSSRLSATEKASLTGVHAAGKKPKNALDLFGSDSSVSDIQAVSSKRPRKRPRESSISKQMSKPLRQEVCLVNLFIFLRAMRTIMVDPFLFLLR
jgi:hypothetical protein